jgi:hypothetical protein
MKKIIAIAAIAIAIFANAAFAKDIIVNSKIDNIVQAISKNGSPYCRITIQEQRELEGVKYTAPVTVMVFGDMVPQVEKLQKGMPFKAVVSEGEYKGNRSLTLVAIIK